MELDIDFLTEKIYEDLQQRIDNSGCHWQWSDDIGTSELLYSIDIAGPYGGVIHIHGSIKTSKLRADWRDEKIEEILK